MSKIFRWGNLACPWSNTIVFIRICFTNWYLWSFFQGDLLKDCSEQRSCMAYHVSLFDPLSQKFVPQKKKSMPFLEHLQKINLELCIQRYCNCPQVSYLGMNSGRGWNPNLERTYILKYSESKDELWTHSSSGLYLRPLKFWAPKPSPISKYCECTKT